MLETSVHRTAILGKFTARCLLRLEAKSEDHPFTSIRKSDFLTSVMLPSYSTYKTARFRLGNARGDADLCIVKKRGLTISL